MQRPSAGLGAKSGPEGASREHCVSQQKRCRLMTKRIREDMVSVRCACTVNRYVDDDERACLQGLRDKTHKNTKRDRL